VSRTLVTQSRMASLIASFKVREPESTPRTSAPSRRMRKTLSSWRRHVLHAHVNHALEPEQRTDGGRGHTVLPGAGLRNDATLAHTQRQQRLARQLLICARQLQQVFTLEVNLGAAQLLGQTPRMKQRVGRPAYSFSSRQTARTFCRDALFHIPSATLPAPHQVSGRNVRRKGQSVRPQVFLFLPRFRSLLLAFMLLPSVLPLRMLLIFRIFWPGSFHQKPLNPRVNVLTACPTFPAQRRQ